SEQRDHGRVERNRVMRCPIPEAEERRELVHGHSLCFGKRELQSGNDTPPSATPITGPNRMTIGGPRIIVSGSPNSACIPRLPSERPARRRCAGLAQPPYWVSRR